MKGLYTIIQILLSAGLIYFGETVGTGNMWYVIAAIITAYIIMDLLYKARRYGERNSGNTKKETNHTNKNISTTPPIPEKVRQAEENARIRVRHFYNDEANVN